MKRAMKVPVASFCMSCVSKAMTAANMSFWMSRMTRIAALVISTLCPKLARPLTAKTTRMAAGIRISMRRSFPISRSSTAGWIR